MKITKLCVYTNRSNTMEINITEEQYQQYTDGVDIDVCCPNISFEEREFLLTGASSEDIDEMYEDDNIDPEHSLRNREWD